jgi:c-di-GMP-binding flagellar brake protein YcgR
MPTFQNIDGENIPELFNKLIQEQTLVKVSLPQTDFESLTVLTDIRNDGQIFNFQIDLPDDLMAAVSNAPLETMSFEFTGKDHLTHRFDAALQEITEKSIWLVSPAAIQRYQMRDNFRIKVLRESNATLEFDSVQVRMEIDNLSVGGVYCYCSNLHKPLFESYPKLEHMDLNITAKINSFVIHVDKFSVNRIEEWMRPNHFGVAFEFIQINKETRKRLIQHIYDLQREFLQNRLKLSE